MIVFSALEKNPYFEIPITIVRRLKIYHPQHLENRGCSHLAAQGFLTIPLTGLDSWMCLLVRFLYRGVFRPPLMLFDHEKFFP